MVWEDGKFYPMMKVVYAPEVCVQPDEVQLAFGPDLIAKAHPVLSMYLQQEVRRQSAVLQQLECSPPGEVIEKRRREVEDYGRLLEEGIRRCTGAKA
jgi:tRNA A22 N-methylase